MVQALRTKYNCLCGLSGVTVTLKIGQDHKSWYHQYSWQHGFQTTVWSWVLMTTWFSNSSVIQSTHNSMVFQTTLWSWVFMTSWFSNNRVILSTHDSMVFKQWSWALTTAWFSEWSWVLTTAVISNNRILTTAWFWSAGHGAECSPQLCAPLHGHRWHPSDARHWRCSVYTTESHHQSEKRKTHAGKPRQHANTN